MERNSAQTRKLMFVCSINRYRSVMAENLFKDIVEQRNKGLAQGIEISSAGIITKEQISELRGKRISIPKPLFGYRPMPCLILYMQKIGIDISEHRSKAINWTMAKEADLIVAMSDSHRDYILSSYPMTKGKVATLAGLSRPFQFPNGVEEPPGLMPPLKFCMLRCDHWSLTSEIISETKERLEEATSKILSLLGVRTQTPQGR